MGREEWCRWVKYQLFSILFCVIISFWTIGKTTDVIGKIIRRDLPYYDFYSHFWIFSDQALSNEKNNPWGLLKIAIKRGILDGSKFTFFGELSKDNINKIKRRAKTDRPALMIVDDKADELGKAPFSLIDARHEHTLHCHVWIMAQQFVFSGGEGIPSQIARQITHWFCHYTVKTEL